MRHFNIFGRPHSNSQPRFPRSSSSSLPLTLYYNGPESGPVLSAVADAIEQDISTESSSTRYGENVVPRLAEDNMPCVIIEASIVRPPLIDDFQTITQNVQRSTVQRVLNDIGNFAMEGLRLTMHASTAFPPLQSVAGALLAILEIFKMHSDNNGELHKLRERLEHLIRAVMWYQEPQVPDGALHPLLTCLDVQLKQVREELERGYFSGLISAKEVKADILTRFQVVNHALRTFQVELALHMRNIIQRQERHKLAEWITPVTFDAEHSAALSLFTPGTTQWFFEQQSFQEWKRGKHPVLWCYGDLGVGKTVLAAQVVQHLEQGFGQNATVLFVYCNSHGRYNLETILRALLRQLVHRSVRSQRLLTAWDHRTTLSLNSVASAVGEELATYSSVFIVVDALDELESPIQSQLLRSLRSISSCICLLFTSRPSIADLFDFQGLAKIEISARRSDLIQYVKRQIEEAQPVLKDAMNRITAEKVSDIVIGKADGMFLMARLQFESLNRCHNYQKVVRMLESLPPTLYDTYTFTLNRLHGDDLELVMQILSWISVCQLPLTTQDLDYALAATSPQDGFHKDQIIRSDWIIHLCGGLVCIKETYNLLLGPVHIWSLVHYTMHEYLMTIRNFLLSSEEVLSACVRHLVSAAFIPPSLALVGGNLPFSATAGRLIPYLLRDSDVKELPNDSFMFDSCLTKYLFSLMNDSFDTDHDGAHFIHLAAYHDLSHVVRHLVSRDPLLANARTKDGYTPLTYAVLSGSIQVVTNLLDSCGVDINSKTRDGRTPLSYAAQFGDERILNYLLTFGGISIDLRDERGRTPLSYATASASCSALFTVKALLDTKSVDVNSTDDIGRTPLSYAASSASNLASSIVKLLLTINDIDVNSNDNEGRTPLSYAAASESVSVLSTIEAFLAADSINISIHSRDKHGRVPLSYAASSWSHFASSIIKALLHSSQSSVHSKDGNGRTPLSYAVSSSSSSALSVVKCLLAIKGIDINSKDRHSRTPLSYAASSASHFAHSIVEVLLATKGIDLNSKDNMGRSALSYATTSTSHSACSTVQKLLACKEIDAHSTDKCGRNPLSYAALSWSRSAPSIIRALVAVGGIGIDSRDKHGRTPLSYAAASGSLYASCVVKVFLAQQRIDVNSTDNTGRTPLSYAAASTFHSAVSIIQALLTTKNIDINLKDHGGRSPLSYATSNRVQTVLFEAANLKDHVNTEC